MYILYLRLGGVCGLWGPGVIAINVDFFLHFMFEKFILMLTSKANRDQMKAFKINSGHVIEVNNDATP
jgi:hypothetical protein